MIRPDTYSENVDDGEDGFLRGSLSIGILIRA